MKETGAQMVEQLCELAARAGRREVCPADECPLWEDGACLVESLLNDESPVLSDEVDEL